MYSDFTFRINDVDPKENTVWLTIDTESRGRARDISTLRKFTNNPDIHDSLVNAYVIANAIIPEFTLWEIVSMMADKETSLGLEGKVDLDPDCIRIKVFIRVKVFGRLVSETDRHNYTDLDLMLYYHGVMNTKLNISYTAITKKFLWSMSNCFSQFISAIRNDNEFESSTYRLLSMLPDVEADVRKLMEKHDELAAYRAELAAKREASMKRMKRINRLCESKDFKVIDLNADDYVELRKRGAIPVKQFVIPEIVKLFKKEILTVDKITPTEMLSRIPQCRHIFDPIAQGEFRVTIDDGYFSDENWKRMQKMVMAICADTMIAGSPKLTKDEIEKIVDKTKCCVGEFSGARGRFRRKFRSFNRDTKTAFILQNTCEIAMQTELNVFVTYDALKSRDAVYITKSELREGLDMVKSLAPWEYARLTR